jgi:hypothetical protein
MKVYVGAATAARTYVEGDRGRVDDYYLAEGTGIARRYAADGERVAELAPLTGGGTKRGSPASTRRRGSRGGSCAATSGRSESSRWW